STLMSTFFPYTTLFRSIASRPAVHGDCPVLPGGGPLVFPAGMDHPSLVHPRRCALQACLIEGQRHLTNPARRFATPNSSGVDYRSEEHTSELQSPYDLV